MMTSWRRCLKPCRSLAALPDSPKLASVSECSAAESDRSAAVWEPSVAESDRSAAQDSSPAQGLLPAASIQQAGELERSAAEPQ